MEKGMEKEDSSIWMVQFMKDNLKMGYLMVMELFIIKAVTQFIKVNGKMKNLKDTVLYIIKIIKILVKDGLNTKANSRMAKNMDLVLCILQMVKP